MQISQKYLTSKKITSSTFLHFKLKAKSSLFFGDRLFLSEMFLYYVSKLKTMSFFLFLETDNFKVSVFVYSFQIQGKHLFFGELFLFC